MQLLEPHRGKRAHRGRKYAVAAVVVILGVAIWQGWQELQPRYLLWKQERALKQAREFIAKRDAPNAQLALDVALRAAPGNPETIRVAADMLEQVNAPQAMRLRRAVVQVVPDSAEDAAKLVLCCLRFRDYNAAKDALSSTPHSLSVQEPMIRAALAFALSTNNSPVADMLFKELLSKFPDDQDLTHAHALILLRHPDPNVRDKARQELETLARTSPTLAPMINREFAGDALQRRDYAEARVRLQSVLASPDATVNDRLQLANLELLVDHASFETVFASVAPLASKSEADIVQFVQWLLVQDRAAAADHWLAGVPEHFRSAPPVRSALADIVAQLADWDRLGSVLQDGAWGPISKDTLRLAFAAKTVDNPGHPSLRRETWDMALASGANNLGSLRVLQRLAAAWQWTDESERTLWTVARTYPDQTWAHQALFNLYREKKNTEAMRDVMNALRQSDGSVPRYQHDWALLTLLLDPTSNWNTAKDTMRQLHESDPADATYTTGYAFALAQAGRGPEALAVVQKLSDDERRYAPRQPYLAFVYGVARQATELEHSSQLAAGLKLLPEESYLFTRAREELNRRPEAPKRTKAVTANEVP